VTTEFEISDCLRLKLERGKTNIYVNDKLFNHCKYLLLNLPFKNIDKVEEINSIDDVFEELDKSLEPGYNQAIYIPPEIEFWGHCSNIQVWYENNYDSRFIHSNLAFPLLKKLTEAGDRVAKKVFKDEIAIRFESGHLPIVQYLLNNKYLDSLNDEEIECLLDQAEENLIENLINELKKLWENSLINYWKIAIIIEIITFLALKYNKNYILSIIENLPENIKESFVKRLILYLNYMEFKDYRIPYGMFYEFFEQLLDYIYRDYPKVYESLKLINSGFLSGAISLDERLSFGAVF